MEQNLCCLLYSVSCMSLYTQLLDLVHLLSRCYTPAQCSHQNLQAKGHKLYLMTTPLILNIVVVSAKHLLHVYLVSNASQRFS